MAIVSASKKGTVIVIDPDENKAREVRENLERSMEKIAIINTQRLSPWFSEINRLMGNGTYWKMFYGCGSRFYEKIVAGFSLKLGEVTYLGWKLSIPEIENHYWKKKGFEPFPPTISMEEGTYGQEL